MTPNVPLLRKTMEHIEAHPQEWDQQVWRCGTTMCFAGTACDLDGGQWADADMPEDEDAPYLLRRDGEPEEDTYTNIGPGLIHAATRARRILGLDETQADFLFGTSNTLDYLRAGVAELCGDDR
jgi:hypothetical protein